MRSSPNSQGKPTLDDYLAGHDVEGAKAPLPAVVPGHWTTPAGQEMALRYLAEPRSALGRSDLTDFELANAQYMASRDDLDLIVYQTAAKERIRWLSAHLAAALAALQTAQDVIDDTRQDLHQR